MYYTVETKPVANQNIVVRRPGLGLLDTYNDALHAVNRHAVVASEEQQELAFLALTQRSEHVPEHLDHRVAGVVLAFVLGAALELLPLVVLVPRHHHLQLDRLE